VFYHFSSKNLWKTKFFFKSFFADFQSVSFFYSMKY
jgi:hypothetical protein